MGPILYSIDREDRIVRVNESWEQFAAENSGESVYRDRVIGRSLWDFISGDTVRDIYRRLLVRVRSGTLARFRYRCDSATYRRTFEMLVTEHAGDVQFVSTLLEQHPHERIPLFDSAAARDDRFVCMCAWCHRIARPTGGWESLEVGVARLGLLNREPAPRITHGICEACARDFMATLN